MYVAEVGWGGMWMLWCGRVRGIAAQNVVVIFGDGEEDSRERENQATVRCCA